MSFRDDEEAARERVAALERDVALVRQRRDADRARIDALERRIAARRWALDAAPSPWRHRILGFFLVAAAMGIIALLFALLLADEAPPPAPRPHKPAVRDAEQLISHEFRWLRMAGSASIATLDARGIDWQGKIHFDRDGRLHVTVAVEPPHFDFNDNAALAAQKAFPSCTSSEWIARNDDFVIENHSGKCVAEPGATHCRIIDIWSRALELGASPNDLATMHYAAGRWTFEAGKVHTVIDDHCFNNGWPPWVK